MFRVLKGQSILDDRFNFLEGERRKRRTGYFSTEKEKEKESLELIELNQHELEVEQYRLQQDYESSRVFFSMEHPLFAKRNFRTILVQMLNEQLIIPSLSQSPLRMLLLKKVTPWNSIPLFTSFFFVLVTPIQSFLLKMTLLGQSQSDTNVILDLIQVYQTMTLVQEGVPLLVQEKDILEWNQSAFLRIKDSESILFLKDFVLSGSLFLCYQENLDEETKSNLITQAMTYSFFGTGSYSFARVELSNGDLVVSQGESYQNHSFYLPLGIVQSKSIFLPQVFIKSL